MRFASPRGNRGFATALAFLLSATPVLAQTNPPAPAAPAQPRSQRPAAPPAPAAPAPQAPAGQPQAGQPAPQATGPAVIQVQADPAQTDWTKVCGKDPATNAEACYTTRTFVSDQGEVLLVVAVFDMKTQQPQRAVRFLLPLGFLLQPGIRFAVDSGQATSGRYAMCLPNGCFAEAQVAGDFINTLKKGTKLNVSIQNQVGREVTFSAPMAGFAKAFDGPPIDPKVLEEQQKKLQGELEKRSEELRKRLESNAGGAAPAAPAAPKP
jgi:invasion protein IalB